MIRVGGRRSIVCAASVALFILFLAACGGTGPARSDTGNTGASIPSKGSTSNQPPSHTLSVSAAPSNGGTVASNPGGINCGTTCSTSFVGGSTIGLIVAPKTGFVFMGWGGACSGTGACSVQLNSDMNVVANFGAAPPPQATLSVTEGGTGTGTVTSSPAGINCGSKCSAALNVGSSVVLTATPGPGSAFAGWTGAACAGVGTCTIALTADTSVMALFVPQYTLSVSQAGTGSGSVTSAPAGINCGTTCSAGFPANAVVNLAANPAVGSAFTGWGGACSGTGTCTVTMASNQAVVANFGPPPTPQFNVTVTAPAVGGGVTSAPAGINCGAGNTACSAAFNSGSSLTLTPAPQAGYVFTGWTGSACAGTAACTFNVTANETIGANFAPLYTITVGLAGTGTGSVTSAPAGINCGATCSSSFQSGTTVTLAATPATGSVFTGWGGACSGSAGCTLTLASNQNVTATFGPAPVPQFTLSTSVTGAGSVTSSPAGISCGATCSANFNQGTPVTLTPTAQAGAAFSGWSGACSGSGACVVTMNSAQSVSATFIPTAFPVTVTTAGTGSGSVTSNIGGINCPGSCSASINTGSTIILTATPAAGSVFAGWTGDCAGTSTCSITVGTSAAAATATFVPAPQNSLSVTKTGTGSGTVTSVDGNINCGATCSANYNQGTSVTLNASAAGGSTFTGWSGGGCSGTGSCSVTMNSVQLVDANFDTTSFAVSVSVAGSGTVTSTPAGMNCTSGTCSSNFNSGTPVILAATPSAGFVFTGWSGGTCAGTSSCSFTMPGSAVNAGTATFTQKFALNVSTTGAGSGTVTSGDGLIACPGTCSASYLNGSAVTLTAAPTSAASTFTGWTGGGCGVAATCTVPMNQVQNVSAAFAIAQFPVTVMVSGSGSVSDATTTIFNGCTGTCTVNVNSGTNITLNETPSGSTFAGWTGACSGTGACSFTVGTSPVSVGAAFSANFALTVTTNGSTGSGTISTADGNITNCAATCSFTYASGTPVTVTESANAGSVFTGWSGACSGTGACSVTMNSALTVGANFAPAPLAVTVATAGSGTGSITSNVGGINCPGTCSANINNGTTVTLTATPAAGSVFTGWSGGTCTGTGACTFTLSGSAVNATATFTPKFNLTAATNGSGTGSVTSGDGLISCPGTCSASYVSGASVTVTATPSSAASTFAGWTGGGCGVSSTCTVSMTSAQSVTATFNVAQFPVTVTVSGSGSGSVTSNVGGISCPGTCTANINSGTLVTLTEIPTSGASTFAGWTGACSGTGACSFTVGTSAVNVGATFSPTPQYTLSVSETGAGTGAVTSNVGTINCPGTCSNSYLQGASVILTATPTAGTSLFAGWSGACTNTSGTCTVTMNSAQSVSAMFIPASYPVTVAMSGTGSGSVASSVGGISCTSTAGTPSGTCSATLNSGTAVNLTATPASAYSVFAGWTGACSGTGICALNVTTSALNVTATFSPAPQSTLTVSNTGAGSGTVTSAPAGINCGATCSANYLNGTPVTLTAAATAGSVFTGWSGGACAGTGTCAVTMNANTAVTASFVPLYTLSVTTAGTGTVTSSPAGINCGATCSSTFSAGTVVSLAAAPGTGQIFSGWSGACSGTGSCSVTLNSSQSVTATFVAAPPPQYSVTIATSGASTGTVTSSPAGVNCGATCSALFNSGTSVILTATPASGYSFSGWGGSSCAGTGNCSVTVTANVSATATFVPVYTLSVALAGTGTGTVNSSPAGINCGATCSMTAAFGSSVSLTATPNSGQVFSGWSGACTGTGACSVSMSSNQSVTATFSPAPPPSYSVTVTLAGTGLGTVTSSDGNINCGTVCTASYTSGSNVTLATTAATGSAFAGWSSAYCSGTGPCTMPVTAAQAVTANFSPVHPLFVTVNGVGTVISSPPGIACPSQCAANFNEGTSVALTPVAANGYSFSGWSGACTGTGSCVVTMSASESVTAGFTQNKYSVSAPRLTVTPSPFSFGNVQTNTTSIQSVQISNTGDASGGDLVITSASFDNSVFAVQPGQFPMTIAPGSAQALSISVTPTATGTTTGTLSFVSNDSTTPATTLAVSANGSTTTGTGGFAVSPTILFFSNVNVGSSVTQTITMSNPGTANTVVTAATVSGSGLSILSPAFPLTLLPGAKQAVVIQFAPVGSGSVTGVITFTSNASSSPVVSVVASANGTTPVTSVLAYPATLNFGAVPFSPVTATYAQNVVLYNTGNTTVTIFSPSITGAGFAISGANYPFTLPVNGTLAFTVTFTPPVAGTSSGMLTFNTNAPAQPSTSLVGTGVTISQHFATLYWCPSSSQVIGYNVYRSTTSGSGYQLISFVPSTASTCSPAISFLDSNVVSGQTYYWVVTAVNAAGAESTYSNEASGTIP